MSSFWCRMVPLSHPRQMGTQYGPRSTSTGIKRKQKWVLETQHGKLFVQWKESCKYTLKNISAGLTCKVETVRTLHGTEKSFFSSLYWTVRNYDPEVHTKTNQTMILLKFVPHVELCVYNWLWKLALQVNGSNTSISVLCLSLSS